MDIPQPDPVPNDRPSADEPSDGRNAERLPTRDGGRRSRSGSTYGDYTPPDRHQLASEGDLTPGDDAALPAPPASR